MEEPKGSMVDCTCKKGCFIYDEPVKVTTKMGTEVIVEGYFIKDNTVRCYIAQPTDKEIAKKLDRSRQEGYAEWVMPWFTWED